MKKSLLFCLGLLTSSLLITGCQPNSSYSETVKIEGITISSSDNVRNIKEGETLQLSVAVYPESASQEVTWTSSDATVATVSETGLVSAVKKGNVNIVATSKVDTSVSQSFSIIVEEGEEQAITPTSITISSKDNKTSCKVGETIELSVKVSPENADTSIVWSSSDESIAKVVRGVVTPAKEGQVIIRAAAKSNEKVYADISLSFEKSDDPIVNLDWDEMDYTSHADYYSEEVENDTPMKIKGVVTHVSPVKEGEVSYFIQNGKDGYYVYAQNSTTFPVQLGESYEVGGYKKYYRGLNEIVNVEHFKKLDEKLTYTVNALGTLNPMDREATSAFHASLVSGTGTITSASVNTSKAYTVYAEVNDNDTQFRIDPSYMTSEAFAAINNKLQTAVAGTTFDFTGYLCAFGYGKPSNQIQIVRADDLVLAEVTPEQVLAAAKEKLSVSTSVPVSKTSISLPTSVEGFEDVTVSWATDSNLVDISTGAVTHGSENQTVKLTATLKIGSVEVTKEFTLTIFANDTTEYETVVSFDLEDALPAVSYGTSESKSGYAEGVVELGTPKAKWLLRNALIGGTESDVREGTFSIRAQCNTEASSTARIEVKEDGDYNVVEFDVAVYGSDAPAQVRIEYSNDSGTTWTASETLIYVDHHELETYRVKLPDDTNRVALVIVENSGRRLNFDNIKLMK